MNKLLDYEQFRTMIMTHYPEQATYWLREGEECHGKHTDVSLTTKCPACGYEETAILPNSLLQF